MGAVDAAAAAAATAHSVSRRETCTSRAASLGPPLVCAARPRISATRGPWRGHGAAMRDIYGRQQHASGIPLDAARSGDARRYVSGGRPSDATSHAMERPWTDRGRAGPRTPLDPGTRRARPVPGRPRPGPDGLGGRGTAGRQRIPTRDFLGLHVPSRSALARAVLQAISRAMLTRSAPPTHRTMLRPRPFL